MKKSTKLKMSLARKKFFSNPENKLKWSLYQQGKPLSEEVKVKISNALLGYKRSKKTIRKISQSKRGYKNPNFGKSTWNKGMTANTDARVKEYTKNVSTNIKNAWKDPNSAFNSKKYRNSLSKRYKLKWKDKEFRKQMKKIQSSYEYIKKQRNAKLLYYKNNPAVIESIRRKSAKQIFPRKNTSLEKRLYNIIRELKIPFKKQQRILNCRPDAVIKSKKIAIFADGTFWHGHPSIFSENDKLRGLKTAGKVWEKDAKQINELENIGYKVLRFWESDLLYMPNEVKSIINDFWSDNNGRKI